MSFIHSLSMGLFHEWRPERVFVILTAYLDESGTHGGSPVTVMGGFLARAGQWRVFDARWGRLIRKRGVSHVHAKHVVHGNKEFRGWTEDRRQRFITKCSAIAAAHSRIGFVAVVKEDEYQRVYRSGERPKKIQLDSKYGLCFRLCLTFLTRAAPKLFGDDIEMHFVLESGHKNSGDVDRLYADFKKNADPSLVKLVKSVTFADKIDCAGLQAADTLSYGALQQELMAPVRFHRAGESERTAKDTCPVHRLYASEAVLNELKSKLLTVEAMKREHWERGRKPPLIRAV